MFSLFSGKRIFRRKSAVSMYVQSSGSAELEKVTDLNVIKLLNADDKANKVFANSDRQKARSRCLRLLVELYLFGYTRCF